MGLFVASLKVYPNESIQHECEVLRVLVLSNTIIRMLNVCVSHYDCLTL
jgi:hypothetical protein